MIPWGGAIDVKMWGCAIEQVNAKCCRPIKQASHKRTTSVYSFDISLGKPQVEVQAVQPNVSLIYKMFTGVSSEARAPPHTSVRILSNLALAWLLQSSVLSLVCHTKLSVLEVGHRHAIQTGPNGSTGPHIYKTYHGMFCKYATGPCWLPS